MICYTDNEARTARRNHVLGQVFKMVHNMLNVVELRKERREAMDRAQKRVIEAYQEPNKFKADIKWYEAQAEFNYYSAIGIRLQELGYTADGDVIPEVA